MSTRIFSFLLLFSVLLCAACGGGGGNADSIQADYAELPPPVPSRISIPVSIEVDQLEKLINNQLDSMDFGAGQAGERLELHVKKADDVKLEVFSDRVRYQVPLDLDIAYDLTLGTARADGVLDLDFISRFTIDSSWNVVTETNLVSHGWRREPKLRLGVVSLPLSTISDYAIRRSEQTIEDNIDLAVAQQLRLAEYITEAWNMLQVPVEVSPEYQAWLQIQPQSLSMTPLRATEKSISAEITLEALPRIAFGREAPFAPPTVFPPFAYATGNEEDRDFSLNVSTLVTYEEAQRLASESVVGETFSSGNRSVTVNDLRLFGSGGQLIVEIATSGSYNGNIYLSGVPDYDSRRNKLNIRDLDFTLKTKSFLTKTAAWLFKSKLRNQIEDNFDAMVTENLDELRTQIEDQLKQQDIAEGIVMRGRLDELNISNTFLTPEGIEVQVAINGNLELDLTEIGKIGE